MPAELPTPRDATWRWAAVSAIAWIASFFTAFLLMAAAGTVGLLVSDPFGLRVDLAFLLALHGLLAAGGVLGAGRLVFERWLFTDTRALVLPGGGLALAIAVELGLHEWAEARFGYYDADMVWWTAGLSFALVALAVATFAAQVAPRSSALAPLLAQMAAATIVALIVLSNVGGIRDGIDSDSRGLAMLVGLSGGYAVAAVVLGVRRASAG